MDLLSVTEPASRAIERVGAIQAEPTRPNPVPQIESRPVRRLQDFVGLARQERIGKKDCRLLLIVSVEQAQAPRDRRAGLVEPPVKLGAGGATVARQGFGGLDCSANPYESRCTGGNATRQKLP